MPYSLFSEGLNLSDDEANRLEREVCTANVVSEAQWTQEYYDKVLRLWFRQFFHNGNGLRQFTPFLPEVLGEEKIAEPRSKLFLEKFGQEAQKRNLAPNVYFNSLAWMIACEDRPDGGGIRGNTSKMVSNFRRCWKYNDFEPDNYQDEYFKVLLSDDASYKEVERLISEAQAENASQSGTPAVRMLREAFEKNKQSIDCDVAWKLYCNGNEPAKIILSFENWLWPSGMEGDRKTTITISKNGRAITKPLDHPYFTLDELRPIGGTENFEVVVHCGDKHERLPKGKREALSWIDKISTTLDENRVLVFEDDGDDSIKWFPLVDIDNPHVYSRFAWVCLRDKEDAKRLPSYEDGKRLTDNRGIVFGYVFKIKLDLADTDAELRQFKTNDGKVLFTYNRKRERYSIERQGFTDDIRVENDRWRVFAGEECSFRSKRGEAEWCEMAKRGVLQKGVAIEGSTCIIRPPDVDAFSEYKIIYSRSRETILHIPKTVLASIREGRHFGEGWSFEADDEGEPLAAIHRAEEEGVKGVLKYMVDGEEKSTTIFVKIPLSQPVFWLESGVCNYESMHPQDVLLDGRTFESWGALDNLWLCSKAPSDNAEDFLQLEARLHDGTRREIDLNVNEGVGRYGRTDITGLLKEIPKVYADGHDSIFFEKRLLFNIKCMPDRLQLFLNERNSWNVLVPNNHRNDSLVLFSERILCNTRDAIVVKQNSLKVGAKELTGFFNDDWGDKPVYAALISDGQQVSEHPWLAEIDSLAVDIQCVRSGVALGGSDLLQAAFAISFLPDKQKLNRCFTATLEAIKRSDFRQQLGKEVDLKRVWSTYAGLPGANIGDILEFLLVNNFNFLAEKCGNRTWLDMSLVPRSPRYTLDYGYQLVWKGGKHLRSEMIDWLPAGLFTYQCQLRGNNVYAWEDFRICEAAVHAHKFYSRWPVVFSSNGCDTPEGKKDAKHLFGLGSKDLQVDCYQIEDKNSLVSILQCQRIKLPKYPLTLLELVFFGDLYPCYIEEDPLDLEHAVLGMLAVVCRGIAHGHIALEAEERRNVCELVQRAFVKKIEGDEQYWRWLMRDIVAVEWAFLKHTLPRLLS